jgi:hypothetical protein
MLLRILPEYQEDGNKKSIFIFWSGQIKVSGENKNKLHFGQTSRPLGKWPERRYLFLAEMVNSKLLIYLRVLPGHCHKKVIDNVWGG